KAKTEKRQSSIAIARGPAYGSDRPAWNRYHHAPHMSAITKSAPPDQTNARATSATISPMRHTGGPRVVISGIGAVSPFGVGREQFWRAVSGGPSGPPA